MPDEEEQPVPSDDAYTLNLRRYRLDAKSGVVPSGDEMEGKVPIPLTVAEYERLLQVFSIGDEALTAGLNRHLYEMQPEQDSIQESLRGKVYRPVIAQKFPVVILDINNEDDFYGYARQFYEENEAIANLEVRADTYQRDYVWTKWIVVKTWGFAKALVRKHNDADPPEFVPATQSDVVDGDGNSLEPQSGHFRDRFVDTTTQDYDDDTPTLVLFTRKTIYFGSQVFVDDVTEDVLGDNTLLGQMYEASDVAEFDPRVQFALDAASLRPTDGGLVTTIPRSAIQPWIDQGPYGAGDPPGGTPGGGVPGGGDPKDPGGEPFPPDGRPGSGQPPGPGGGGGGTNGYPPPAPPAGTGGRVELDCAENPVFSATGTNGSESFASFLGVDIPSWLSVFITGGIALPDVYKQEYHQDIYGSIVAAIEGSGELPSSAKISRVVLCYHWIATIYYGISLFGVESFISKRADVPKLTAHRTVSSTLTKYILKNDETYKMVDFTIGIPDTPAELSFAWRVGEATPDQHLVITQFDTVDTLTLDSKLYPAFSDFFGALPVSPILYIGVEEFDWLYQTGPWDFSFTYPSALVNGSGIWDDNGLNVRVVQTRTQRYDPNDTWNSSYVVAGATGDALGDSYLAFKFAAAAAYTSLAVSFYHGNYLYTPTMTPSLIEIDGTTGGDVTSGDIITMGAFGPLASTGGIPNDFANNLVQVSHTFTLDHPVTLGKSYRLSLGLNASIGMDNFIGTWS